MRNRHFLLLDFVLLAGLPALAVGLGVEHWPWPAELVHSVTIYALFALGARLVVARATGLYQCLWQHASVSELERILYAGVLSGVVTFLLGTVGLTTAGLIAAPLPYDSLVLEDLLAIAVFATPRLFARFGGHRSLGSTTDLRAIVVGAGAAGKMILRETQVNQRLKVHVVAFVDDDPYKQKQLLGGVPVAGKLADLPSVIHRMGAGEVIIAMPQARGAVIRRVVEAANIAGVRARTMPGFGDLISGRVDVSTLRRVEIQDILRRDAITTDLSQVMELLTGKTSLVTGAGGSIGSELCRQIAATEPSTLVVVDHSENHVFEIDRELRKRFPKLQLVPIIADIRDPGRVHAIVARHRPHAIFHAAAHKHVPLMEENVDEAITNNVLGTRNVVDAALDADTAHLVNISTDKAVRPTSVMGATKRIAEMIVFNAAQADRRNFVSVRFGNVLGSSGSVIPTFMKQIREGGPITVTHPEMKRYFMTIPEAVQLVLQAGALSEGSDLFVLDMGELIRIADLARDLIRLSGLEEGADIELVYTGIRPGEKLYEEVFFGGEDVRPTVHPKVLRAIGEVADPRLAASVESLIQSAIAYTSEDCNLRDQLRNLVPDFARTDVRAALRTAPAASVLPSVDMGG